jgi:hypothetical protein
MLIDTKEAARRLNLSTARVIQLLRESRIKGGAKMGGQRGVWVIDVPGDGPPVVLPTASQAKKAQ